MKRIKESKFYKVIHNCWIYLILILFGVFYFLNFTTAQVSGISMFPTYKENDMLLVFKTANIRRGDVVVIWSDKLNEYIVKRVIGLSGDFVTIKNNKVYVNNNLQEEPYINEDMEGNIDSHNVVDVNSVYVMGDNRNLSMDSRVLGTIKNENIRGVVLLDLTKTLHYNRVASLRFLMLVWILFFIYLIYNFIIINYKKWKARHE